MQPFQLNHIFNYKNNILDLVIFNDIRLVVTSVFSRLFLLIWHIHHLQIDDLNTIKPYRITTKPSTFYFKRSYFEVMNKFLNDIVWKFLLSDTLDLSSVISNFYLTIYKAIFIFTLNFSNSNYKYP